MLPRVSALSDTERAWSVLRDGRLAPSARVALPVLSGSMQPLLPVDAVLEIAGAGARDLARGDIVVFRDGDTLTAHRVLLVLRLPGRCLVYQKGDTLPRGAWIDGRRVVGVATSVTAVDGARTDFRLPAVRAEARALARRYLRWDLRWRLLRRG